MAYDEVLLDLKQTNMRLGLKPGVLALVKPVLDGFAAQDLEDRLIWEQRSPWSQFGREESRCGEQSQLILRVPKTPTHY